MNDGPLRAGLSCAIRNNIRFEQDMVMGNARFRGEEKAIDEIIAIMEKVRRQDAEDLSIEHGRRMAELEALAEATLNPVRAKALELALAHIKPDGDSYADTFARADMFVAYLTNTHEEDDGDTVSR